MCVYLYRFDGGRAATASYEMGDGPTCTAPSTVSTGPCGGRVLRDGEWANMRIYLRIYLYRFDMAGRRACRPPGRQTVD